MSQVECIYELLGFGSRVIMRVNVIPHPSKEAVLDNLRIWNWICYSGSGECVTEMEHFSFEPRLQFFFTQVLRLKPPHCFCFKKATLHSKNAEITSRLVLSVMPCDWGIRDSFQITYLEHIWMKKSKFILPFTSNFGTYTRKTIRSFHVKSTCPNAGDDFWCCASVCDLITITY